MSSFDDVARKLDALWQTFLPTMHSRLAVLHSAIESLQAKRLDEDLRRKAAHEAHKLAGSLGTFGLSPASDHALRIEHLLSSSGPIHDRDCAELSERFAKIREAIQGRDAAH